MRRSGTYMWDGLAVDYTADINGDTAEVLDASICGKWFDPYDLGTHTENGKFKSLAACILDAHERGAA